MAQKLSPYLNLALYDSSDNDENFILWRVYLAGSQSTSNFMKIDTKAKQIDDKLTVINSTSLVIPIYASKQNDTLYAATSTHITEYKDGLNISLSLDQDIIGTTGIAINELGTRYLKKFTGVDDDGNNVYVDISKDDLIKNKEYVFRYNETENIWVLVSLIDVEDFYANGVEDNIPIYSANHRVVDSGVSIDMLKHFKGYYETVDDLKTAILKGNKGDYSIVESETAIYIWTTVDEVTGWFNINAILDKKYLQLSGGKMTGNIDMGEKFISNLGPKASTFTFGTIYPSKLIDIPANMFLEKIVMDFTEAFTSNVTLSIGIDDDKEKFVTVDENTPQEIAINEVHINKEIDTATTLYVYANGTPSKGSVTIKAIMR